MSSLRRPASQPGFSHPAVSAVLRGLPALPGGTGERLLRHLTGSHRRLSGKSARHGVVAILYVKAGKGRGRAALARHRAIVGAAQETARRLGYGTDRLVLTADELPRLPGILRERDYRSLLVLPGPDADTLRRICRPFFPCVYADLPTAGFIADSVAPDYQQSIFLALRRLRAAGLRRPGLVLDCDLSLPAREHLIHAHGLGLSAAGAVTAPPFFTPTRSIESFEAWFRKNAFDSLLTTDPGYARRLAPAEALPVFDLDLNLSVVGRMAVEMLHERETGRGRHGTLALRIAATASRTVSEDVSLPVC